MRNEYGEPWIMAGERGDDVCRADGVSGVMNNGQLRARAIRCGNVLAGVLDDAIDDAISYSTDPEQRLARLLGHIAGDMVGVETEPLTATLAQRVEALEHHTLLSGLNMSLGKVLNVLENQIRELGEAELEIERRVDGLDEDVAALININIDNEMGIGHTLKEQWGRIGALEAKVCVAMQERMRLQSRTAEMEGMWRLEPPSDSVPPSGYIREVVIARDDPRLEAGDWISMADLLHLGGFVSGATEAFEAIRANRVYVQDILWKCGPYGKQHLTKPMLINIGPDRAMIRLADESEGE